MSAIVSRAIALDFDQTNPKMRDINFISMMQDVVTRMSDETLELMTVSNDRDEEIAYLLVDLSSPSYYAERGIIAVVDDSTSMGMSRSATPTEEVVSQTLEILRAFEIRPEGGDDEFQLVLSVH